MDDLLELAKNYNKEHHISKLAKTSSSLNRFIQIYDESWESNNKYPYETITQLLDCYYCLPERPDLASLFGWQAINFLYNQYSLLDASIDRLKDTIGIEKLVAKLYNNYSTYEPFIKPYILSLTDKTYRYVASYILKGYVMEEVNISSKYINSSYNTFKKRFKDFFDIIKNSYGEAYKSISSPSLSSTNVNIGIPEDKIDNSRKIIHSFSKALRELVTLGKTNITEKNDKTKTHEIIFSDKDKLTFVLFCILYASRCNNFHGNVASRLNSIHADNESYTMYFNIFLLEYIIIAITLHEQGFISIDTLKSLSPNEKLLL